ncbi:MAG: glucose-6-phosphate isomerase [Pseudomonadota bacterium]
MPISKSDPPPATGGASSPPLSLTIADGATALYRHDVSGTLAHDGFDAGLDPAQLEATLAALEAPLQRLRQAHGYGSLAILNIVDEREDIETARAALDRLSEGARTLLFFGTGGSGLGGQTLAQLAGWNIPGAADKAQKRRPRTRFFDNLDAHTLTHALPALDLATTRFIITSKSGGTVETLAQAILALDAVKAAGLEARIPELFLGLTEPAREGHHNGLRALCDAHGITVLDHHTGIGGRFSALTNVGLLPALARGLDPFGVRAGAKAVVDAMLNAPAPHHFAPAVGAAAAICVARDLKRPIQVMMPYCDRLARFSHWFVQLWAESLGKGGAGTSPIAALGPLDQHSQLQLFMDGPPHHWMTLLRLDASADATASSAPKEPRIDPALAALAGLDYIAGRTVGEITRAQSAGVAGALNAAGRPVRSFFLPALDERTLGALMMHFMVETILAGALLNVDPFDQPAVELAKRFARDTLGGAAEG